ncbi:MAG TPA: hypothetical protein VKZ97_05110 [Flavobacteriaceae bacterium]|nr:hypothetical protein [Flavobacteriaceae bacterium]
MAWRTELAGRTTAFELGEHILIDIALGVLVGHIDAFEFFYNLVQHGGLVVAKAGTAHMGAKQAFFFAQRANERKNTVDVVGKNLVALVDVHFLEVFPPELLLVVVKDGGIVFFEPFGHALVTNFGFVQVFDKDEIGKLLNNGKGVGLTAFPEGVPDGVNLRF